MARRGLGSISGKTTKSLSLNPVNRSFEKKTKGIYPSGDNAGRFGSTRYGTVLENYNRESDYARWRHGQQYYIGLGSNFAERTVAVRSHFLIGDQMHQAQVVLSLFPSKSSSDSSWTTARRSRGSIVSKTPFDRERATIDGNRLVYQVVDEFQQDELMHRHLQLLVGDQIEDSFEGSRARDKITQSIGSIALTLLEVDVEEKLLVFDLTKPQGRVMVNGHLRWTKLDYDASDPWRTIWRPGNYLGTALRFYCNCPDFSKSMTANTQSTKFDSTGRRFPMPSASRKVNGDYEQEMAGYMKRWGDLSIRADERRDCKHTHCMRWDADAPWIEPNDMPLGMEEDRIHAGSDVIRDDAFSKTMDAYQRNSIIDWSGVISASCGALGFNIAPQGDMANRFERPILWNLDRRPEPEHCRQNDYWLERGTKRLWLYMAEADEWVNEVTLEDGSREPIVSYIEKEELKRVLKEAV
jgi:hypothetical protein